MTDDFINLATLSGNRNVKEQRRNSFFSNTTLDEDYETDAETLQQEGLGEIVQIHSQNSYSLSYACVLVPRFNEHYLMGDIVDYLTEWMLDICISYGWQLKHISIEPAYLHWVMAVNITSYPTKFMKLIRKHTSEKILENFPRFRAKNVSSDFWAPWYYVGTGELPFSHKVIMGFLAQVRKQQGLYK